jgi:hypothetical protein
MSAPSRLLDDERVSVPLSPALAKEVARALRIELGCELDRSLNEPLPSREDAGRLRTILDLSVDQLETLGWGEPSGNVTMMAPRLLLETVAQDLIDGGNESLAHPLEAHNVRAQARQMIRAANVINRALASARQYQIAQ